MSKSRIAVLISMLLAAPAAVVVAQSASESKATEPPQELQAAAEPVTTEVVAVEQTTVVVEQVEVTEAPAQPIARIQQATLSDTFPQGTYSEEWNLKSRHAAYLAQSGQSSMMIAFGSSFPAGTNGDEVFQHLPRQIAYLEQREQQRMASIPEESAQAGSAELALSSAR